VASLADAFLSLEQPAGALDKREPSDAQHLLRRFVRRRVADGAEEHRGRDRRDSGNAQQVRRFGRSVQHLSHERLDPRDLTDVRLDQFD
jgi:hypothetical protein